MSILSKRVRKASINLVLLILLTACSQDQTPNTFTAVRCRKLAPDPFAIDGISEWHNSPDPLSEIENYVSQSLNLGASEAIIEGRLLQVGIDAKIYWADFNSDLKLDGVLLADYAFGTDLNFHQVTSITAIRCLDEQYTLERIASSEYMTRWELVAVEDFYNDGRGTIVLQSRFFSIDGACELRASVVAIGPNGIQDHMPLEMLPVCPGSVAVEDIDGDGMKEVVVVGKKSREESQASQSDLVYIHKVNEDLSLTRTSEKSP